MGPLIKLDIIKIFKAHK